MTKLHRFAESSKLEPELVRIRGPFILDCAKANCHLKDIRGQSLSQPTTRSRKKILIPRCYLSNLAGLMYLQSMQPHGFCRTVHRHEEILSLNHQVGNGRAAAPSFLPPKTLVVVLAL
ncbi:hypothetical protein M0657_008634 [Pyricularia oryzae]|nr:hypothetical protein M0657_008634 [Pyricularia oryzae]KAI7922081.1 hypothetical protein M9X92_005071 [Pyricularia oryzae]